VSNSSDQIRPSGPTGGSGSTIGLSLLLQESKNNKRKEFAMMYFMMYDVINSKSYYYKFNDIILSSQGKIGKINSEYLFSIYYAPILFIKLKIKHFNCLFLVFKTLYFAKHCI
jgi:hypothetical protein